MDSRVLASKKKYEGKLFKSNMCGDVVVLEYISSTNIKIRFTTTEYERSVDISCLLGGGMRDPTFPSVYGVGWLGEKFSKSEFRLQSYICWNSLLFRCYHKSSKLRSPTYHDCSVSENFKCYSKFKEWCNKQIGFGLKDDNGKVFALDKDILIKGNKQYSEDACCFVPREINNLFNTHKNSRGGSTLGVQGRGHRFNSTISQFGVRRSLGVFDTEEQAFMAYKQAKEDYIKEIANKWKDQIDPRVYEALMIWEVEGTD